MKNKQKFLNDIRNIAVILIGTAILAFGTAIFIVPFDLVTGGVSGIAIILENIIDLNISIDIYIGILTWGLFLLGLIFIGKDFALKTLISSIFYPILFSLFFRLVDPNIMNGLFVINNSTYNEISVFLAAIFGGITVGFGCAITFIAGGSTGGIDILAFLICKVFKRVKSTHIIFAIDSLIIMLGVISIGNVVLSLIGISSAFVCSFMIDKIFLCSSTAYVAHIITDKYDEVSKYVIDKMNRTTTIVDVKGAYSGANKKMVIVSFNIREYSILINTLHKLDSKAFIIVYKAHEMHGEGWKKA